MITLPLDLTIGESTLRVTRVGPDAVVFHCLADFDGEVKRTSDDIPASGFTLTDETTEADILAHLSAPPANNDTTAEWMAFLAGSITDAQTGIRLKANQQARNDFIGQAVLLREALDVGAVEASTPVKVWDADNVEHVLTVAEARGLLVRYGIEWNEAFNEIAP